MIGTVGGTRRTRALKVGDRVRLRQPIPGPGSIVWVGGEVVSVDDYSDPPRVRVLLEPASGDPAKVGQVFRWIPAAKLVRK